MKRRLALVSALLCLVVIAGCSKNTRAAASEANAARGDPLPSWNDGSAKAAIISFVRTTTDKNNSKFVPPKERIATFDQDGTTWVEHPIYSQVLFAFNRVIALAPQHPEWKMKKPFQAVIDNDKEAMDEFTLRTLKLSCSQPILG
jgi:hypothetical protein